MYGIPYYEEDNTFLALYQGVASFEPFICNRHKLNGEVYIAESGEYFRVAAPLTAEQYAEIIHLLGRLEQVKSAIESLEEQYSDIADEIEAMYSAGTKEAA